MPTTTNFGWTTPADTDLVKDGAAAIRTLGSNIDTSLVDLKGGTTGQYLQKNSGTDLDYVWGDVSAGGMTLLSTTSLTGATTTISGISGSYNTLVAHIFGVTNATADGAFRVAPNATTTISGSIYISNTNPVTWSNLNNDYMYLTSQGGEAITRTDAENAFFLQIDNYASTTARKSFQIYGGFDPVNTSGDYGYASFGYIKTTSAITSLVFSNAGGNLSTGTVLLYGVK
jgi:hypothetical protein